MREQIRALQRRLGTTTLFVTHDQEEALSMADRVGVMRDGRLEQIDAPDELYANPATAFAAEFVGVMNRLPGELSGASVRVLGVAVPVKGAAVAAGLPDGPADVLVRPEGLLAAVAADGNGIVTSRSFLGSVTRLSVLIGDVTIQVDKPSGVAAAIMPGTPVAVTLPPAEPVLIAPRA